MTVAVAKRVQDERVKVFLVLELFGDAHRTHSKSETKETKVVVGIVIGRVDGKSRGRARLRSLLTLTEATCKSGDELFVDSWEQVVVGVERDVDRGVTDSFDDR